MNQLNNQLNSELKFEGVPRACSNQANTINGLTKLNKDSVKNKVIRVGDKFYVCELDSNGKLIEDARKFIQSERIKLWHQNHDTPAKKNKHCSTCRCEENFDENGNRIYGKRGPKGSRKNKTNKRGPLTRLSGKASPTST